MIHLSEIQLKAIQNAIKSDGLSPSDKNILTEMIDVENSEDQIFSLYVDGAADLHSKTAGIGGVVYLHDQEVACFSEPLFDKTNNDDNDNTKSGYQRSKPVEFEKTQLETADQDANYKAGLQNQK